MPTMFDADVIAKMRALFGPESVPSAALKFPSGATVLTQGEKIVGRVEAPAERQREPLPYFAKRAEFDPFKGWFTDSETGQVHRVEHSGAVGSSTRPTHPLQRSSGT